MLRIIIDHGVHHHAWERLLIVNPQSQRAEFTVTTLVDLLHWLASKGEVMNFFKNILGRFTVRGKALAKVAKGRDCANNHDADNAIKHYIEVVDSSESPREVIAMALFNRALVYSTTGRDCKASEDLNSILCMPESIAEIKKSASDKLVRMRRKQEREESATIDA